MFRFFAALFIVLNEVAAEASQIANVQDHTGDVVMRFTSPLARDLLPKA